MYVFDTEIFQSERLTIVVTHYDTYFRNQQAQVSVADVKKTIASTLKKTFKLEVSENIIFPVCGKWASDVSRYNLCRFRPYYFCKGKTMQILFF